MWLRNYYNLLTAALLADDTLSSTSQPTDYAAPIMVHLPNNNWAAAQGASCTVSTISTDTGSKVSVLTLGKGKAHLVTSDSSTSMSYQTSGECFGIALGSGDTAETYEDYKLANIITSGLTIVSSAGTLAEATSVDANHHIKSKRTFTINNTSSSPITISEYGIYAGYNSSGNPLLCLVYREVLEEPVTLAPSESFIVSFNRDAEIYNYTPYPA